MEVAAFGGVGEEAVEGGPGRVHGGHGGEGAIAVNDPQAVIDNHGAEGRAVEDGENCGGPSPSGMRPIGDEAVKDRLMSCAAPSMPLHVQRAEGCFCNCSEKTTG